MFHVNRYSYIFWFCCISILQAQEYESYRVSLFSLISPETSNNWYASQTKYSGCYGWHNPKDNREYAILGSTKGNHFIEVTHPNFPELRDFVPGASQNSLWREIKTYQHYAYLVSDDNGSKLQIVDLNYLPDSVHLVYESSDLFSKSHTIFIDRDKLYCGGVTLNGSNNYTSMVVYDLKNPEQPVLLRRLNQDYPFINYVHDMYVQNDTIYASAGTQGLYILKFDSLIGFNLLADYTNYFEAGYNHSSYTANNSKTLVFTDEVPDALSAKLIDISDFNNIQLADTIKSNPGATAHNPYVLHDRFLFLSYYQDGVYIYDVSNPKNAQFTGYFDTDYLHGKNDNYSFSTPYRGCWAESHDFVVFSNPTTDNLKIRFNAKNNLNQHILIKDISGKIIYNEWINVRTNSNQFSIPVSEFQCGIYLLEIENQYGKKVFKWVKQQ